MTKRKWKIFISLFIILLSSALIIAVIYKNMNQIRDLTPTTEGVYDGVLDVTDDEELNEDNIKMRNINRYTTLELNNRERTLIIIFSSVFTSAFIYLIITNLGRRSVFYRKENIALYLLIVMLCSAIVSIINFGIINNFYDYKNKNIELKVGCRYFIEDKEMKYLKETLEENEIGKSVLYIKNSNMDIVDSVINKSGDTNSQVLSNDEGMNSGIIVLNSYLRINNTNITTDGLASSAIFAKGRDTNVDIDNSKIVTLKDNSHGILLREEAVMNIKNTEIDTRLRNSYGVLINSGTINIENSIIKTSNEDAHAIHVKGRSHLKNCSLISDISDALVLEDSGNIIIENTDIKTNRIISFRNNEVTSELPATMTINNGTIQTNNSLFNIFNNKTIINLSNVNIKNGDILLRITKDDNNDKILPGSYVELNANNQKLTGEIIVDSLSSLVIDLKNSSQLTTKLNQDNLAKNIILNISKDSKLILSSDIYIHSFINEQDNFSNIIDNGYNIYYDKNNVDNTYLSGKTHELRNGGVLKPM